MERILATQCLPDWGEPENLDRDAVDFVVRVAPEWRIEFFSCVGNG